MFFLAFWEYFLVQEVNLMKILIFFQLKDDQNQELLHARIVCQVSIKDLLIQNQSLDKISDHILQNSYQIVGSVIVSETSDQSILVLKLPNPESSEEVDEMDGAMELPPNQINLYHQMLSKGETDSEKIQLLLKENGFDFLAGRDVFFRCNCSHKRMIQNLHLYQQNDPQPLFDESQTSLSVTCEYCKKEYQITAEDLNQNPYVIN